MPLHSPEATAGAQLAMIPVLKLLLTPYRGNAQAISALTNELEEVRALLLSTDTTEATLAAFESAAESFLEVVAVAPGEAKSLP